MKTFGRIKGVTTLLSYNEPGNTSIARLLTLIQKLDADLSVAKVEENYFAKGGEFEKKTEQLLK